MFKKCKYTNVVYLHFLNMLKSINCKKKKYTITAKRFLVFKIMFKITKKKITYFQKYVYLGKYSYTDALYMYMQYFLARIIKNNNKFLL